MGEAQNVSTGTPTRTEPAQGKKLLDRAWDALRAAGFEQGAVDRYVIDGGTTGVRSPLDTLEARELDAQSWPRSQARVWERTVLPALPAGCEAEPREPWVTRRSLATRTSARTCGTATCTQQ